MSTHVTKSGNTYSADSAVELKLQYKLYAKDFIIIAL